MFIGESFEPLPVLVQFMHNDSYKLLVVARPVRISFVLRILLSIPEHSEFRLSHAKYIFEKRWWL